MTPGNKIDDKVYDEGLLNSIDISNIYQQSNTPMLSITTNIAENLIL